MVGENANAFRARQRISMLPGWRDPISVEPLLGGISNESWLISDSAGQHVVRFGEDYPFHQVCRKREVMTARAAHAAGFAPELHYAGDGVMISAFLNAKTYGAEDVCRQPERLARLVHDFHDRMPHHVSGAGYMFWVFHVIRDYALTLEQAKSRFSDQLSLYRALADELEQAQIPLPIIFGHNDLLPANFLDDGDRLWLIDFEYAGFSTAMFDLAGMASNASMNADQSEGLLATYFGASPSAELKRSHSAMQCASLLREAMWSMVSELYLNAPGVDYAAYTADNLERLEIALDTYHSTYGKSPS